MKKPFIAPSGFEFPFFPYDENTLVRINDRTNYRYDFLDGHDKETYDQADFDHDLEPYCLDIDIDGFDILFKASTLKKLGIKKPPTGWLEFHYEVQSKIEGEEEPIWSIRKTIHKQLLQLGLLKQLPETKSTQELHFSSFLKKDLQEICNKQGLKHTGNKGVLINRIVEHGKPKAKLATTLTDKYFIMVEKLANNYLKDIETQLSDKPKAYAVVIWELVSEEYGIGGELPPKARAYAEKRVGQLL